MEEIGKSDTEQTTPDAPNRQPYQTPTSDPGGKISDLIYDFLKLPNPYSLLPKRFAEPSQNIYSVVGSFIPTDIESAIEHVICCLRTSSNAKFPYTLSEFKRLIKCGTLIEKIPSIGDPDIYKGDPILRKIESTDPLYKLRKAFIFREAYRNYQNQQYAEQDILTRFWANNGTTGNHYQSYLAYLKIDASDQLAPFFRKWHLPITEFERERHTVITAKTGFGKSELIKLAIHGDITSKHRPGVILLEPHGELSEAVAKLKENYGSDRLIFIDPTLSEEFSPTINPLEIEDRSPRSIDRASEELIEVFRVVLSGNGSEFTSNMETLLLACVSTLILKGNCTLFDLLDFMDDRKNSDLVEFAVKNLKNKAHLYLFTNDFRANADNKGNQFSSTKAAIRTKLFTLLSSNALYNFVIGKSTINLKEAMDSGKLIIVRLPKDLGSRSIEAIGRFFTATVQNTAFERSKIPESMRKRVHMYIDECHRFVSPTINNILTDARKYMLFLTFSTQILGQDADSKLKQIISSCTNVKITGANDYASLSAISKETGLEVEKMQELKVGEFYVKAGQKPNIKIKAPSYLRADSSYMTEDQWKETIKEQIAKYYRKIEPSLLKEPALKKGGRRPGSPIEI